MIFYIIVIIPIWHFWQTKGHSQVRTIRVKRLCPGQNRAWPPMTLLGHVNSWEYQIHQKQMGATVSLQNLRMKSRYPVCFRIWPGLPVQKSRSYNETMMQTHLYSCSRRFRHSWSPGTHTCRGKNVRTHSESPTCNPWKRGLTRDQTYWSFDLGLFSLEPCLVNKTGFH